MRTNLEAVIKFIFIVIGGVGLVGITGWGALALFYLTFDNMVGRTVLAVAFGLLGLAALAGLIMRHWHWGRTALICFFVAFALLLVWWSMVQPSNSRDWQPDVARLATATIDGDSVTIHNVRNFDYRTETDFTPRYYDKTYDLKHLSSVDVALVYWMGPAIAHVMLSFGFADRDYMAVSIEMRKEKGEEYSVVKGFFRQYELYYVVADERDVIRVRTNFRNPEEQVYLYRTQITPENARILFLDYLRTLNQLAEKPDFYHALTSNCTTNILLHARGFPNRLKYNWKVLLSGYAAEYLYEIDGLDTKLPFEELKRRSLINERAHQAGNAEDFSRRVRDGLPNHKP